MTRTASLVLGTVNAPYGAQITADQLAACISDLDKVNDAYAEAFSFYTEVSAAVQKAFISEMHLDMTAVKSVANFFASKVPYPVHLAA